MRFLCDNDVPDEVAEGLRRLGHEAVLIRQELGAGAADSRIWQLALQTGRIVITCNRDDYLALADAAHERGAAYPGLIVVKQRGGSGREWARVRNLIERAGESGIAGNINFA